MKTALRNMIQGLGTQFGKPFMLLAVVFALFFAATLDPLLAAGLGGLVFALIWWFLARRVARPLKELSEAAQHISCGEYAARLPVPEGGGEIAVLATAMNELLACCEKQTGELFARKSQFLDTFENAAVGIAHTALDGRWLRVNSKLCEITGYSREEMLAMTFMDISHPAELEADMANVRAMLAGAIPSYSMEKRYIRKDGTPVWTNLTVTLARDDDGQPAYFIAVSEDISARKRAEEALRRSEDRFRIAAESMSDLVYDLDLRTDTIERFGKFEAALGYEEGEIPRTTQDWASVIHPDDQERVMAEFRRACDQGGVFFTEYRVLCKDGSIRHWANHGRSLYDAEGNAVRWIGAITDITERKQVEETLRKSEELLRMGIEVGRVHAFEWDPITDEVTHTVGFGELLGLEGHESHYTGREYFAMVHPDDRVRFERAVFGLNPVADTYVVTYRVVRPDARVITFEERARGFFDEQGRMVRLVGMTADITSRAATERALRESEERLRLATEVGRLVAFEWDPLSDIVVRSESFGKLLGVTDENGRSTGQEFFAMLHPDDRAPFQEQIAGLTPSSDTYTTTFRVIRTDGRVLSLEERARGFFDEQGRMVRLVGMTADITERKRAEDALRRSEERFKAIIDSAHVAIQGFDREGRVLSWNKGAEKLFGWTAGEAIGKTLDQLMLDEAGAREFVGMLAEIDRTGLPVGPMEWPVRNRTGENCVAFSMIYAIPSLRGGKEFVCLDVDITDRKRAEEKLRKSERTLSLAVDGAAMGTWDWDSVTERVTWSKRACDILGLPHGTTADRESSRLVVAPEDREWVAAAAHASIQNGEDYDVEHRIVRPDGTVRWIASKGRTLLDEKGRPVRMLGVITDITERKRGEEALSAAKEAAEAANRAKDDFLASLSHELRTPLNPVLMLASEMEQSDALSPTLREDFTLIRKNIALEARLIDDLLDLTRITRGKLQLELRRVNAHEVLNQALAVVHADLAQKQVAVSMEPNAPNCWVKADPVRLQQIFWNVLSNAVKFTPSGGRITVRTHNTPEQFLGVEIADTGIGMTPEELARMFTAFTQGEHATQPGSQHRFGGLGLGLTISRQLVAMHGGHIHARSPGRGLGSTFVIELPLATVEGRPSGEAPGFEHSKKVTTGAKHFHILLVEDHEPTRKTLERLLRRRGHDVMSADSLAAGRKLVADLATPKGEAGFDLLISGLGLPDGNGCELMTELLKRYHAAVRGVALSGFGMEEDIQRSLASGFSSHLTKPVDMQSLEKAMEAAK